MKRAILFSGQGLQQVGMGRDIAHSYDFIDKIFRRADEILGYSLSDIMFNGTIDQLTITSNCQPALYVYGWALFSLLKAQYPSFTFDVAAGLSLGELTAHTAVGNLDFESGLQLVMKRALYMQEACEYSEGSMLAILGSDTQSVYSLAANTDLDIANFNSPGQIVLSGPTSSIALALGVAREYGIRKAIELNVQGAFHSRLMHSAAEKFKVAIENTDIICSKIPVISNIDALPKNSAIEIRRSLISQITSSVLWCQTAEMMVNSMGIDEFVVFDATDVLVGFLRRTVPDSRVVLLSGDDAFNQITAF